MTSPNKPIKKSAPKKPVVKKPRVKKVAPPPLEVPAIPAPASVIEAVQREVDSLPVSVRSSALALNALHLARVLTQTDAARDSAAISKELRATLGEIRDAVGNAADRSDALDEIKAQREKRRAKAGM